MAPEILLPERFDLHSTLVLTRPGAITPWGDEISTHQIAMGNPLGWARIAAAEGLINYAGRDRYTDLSGNPIAPGDVLSRFEGPLRQQVGPRWLPSAFDKRDAAGTITDFGVKTPFGGQVPSHLRRSPEFEAGRDELLSALGMSKQSVARRSYSDTWNNMVSVAAEEALLLMMAASRSIAAGGASLEEIFPDPRDLGLSTGRGMPGLNHFLTLALGAAEGKKVATGMLLPNLLQSAANGVLTAVTGPKGAELPNPLSWNDGVRTLGFVSQSSHECASFHGALCLAANRVMSRARGQRTLRGILVGASETPHGNLHARLSAVGFNSLRAMETMEWIKKCRKEDDLWHGYPPFTDASHGFWPGEGAGLMRVMPMSAAVAAGIPFDAILAGWSVVPDQGGKANHASLGIGMVNAFFESMRMAVEGHGIDPGAIDYMSFHGTGTPDTNTKEPLLLVQCLQAMGCKKGARRIKATALKGYLTHLLGAAGAAELTMILLSMRNGKAPGLFNLIDGRKIIVPDDVQEWIDFSSEPLERDIDVAVSWSEGFSGNNASLVLLRASDEALARYGLTRDQVRTLRERQGEKLAVAEDLDERLRTGKLSHAELLDWGGFQDRSARLGRPTFRTVATSPTEPPALPSELEGIQNQVGSLAYQNDRWVVLPVHAIREALASGNGEERFATQIERLDDVIQRLRAGDPSAYFSTTGLPHAIRTVTESAEALQVLAQNDAVSQAIDSFANPASLKEVDPPKIPTDAAIPAEGRVQTLLFPGQGMFDEKRTGPARVLYDSDPAYRAVIDEAHERLHERYGYDLRNLLFSGTPDQLVQTRHQQPVLVTDTIGRAEGVIRRLVEAGGHPRIALGDSLGLIPAAYYAGYFGKPADAVEFAYLRGDVMSGLNPFGSDARPMALFPKFDEATLRAVVDQVSKAFGVHVVVSKRNGVNMLVVSGEPEAVQLVGQRVATLGGKMTSINVSTPFHDPHYFGSAADNLLVRARAAGLTGSRRPTGIALIANSTGSVVPEWEDGLEFLAGEIAAPVDLVGSLQTAAQKGGNVFVEVGPAGYVSRAVGTALGVMNPQPGPIHAAFISAADQVAALIQKLNGTT